MKTSLSTPRALRAKSAKGLERAMLQNNLKRQAFHQYQIVHDGNYWFAWYYVDLSTTIDTKEFDEITTQKGD